MRIKCQHCGSPAEAKCTLKKFCSKKCADAARSRRRAKKPGALFPRPCDECGRTYQPKNGGQRYCSSECKYQVDKRRQQEVKRANRESRCCPVCTGFFFQKSGGHKYCSDGCRDKSAQEQRRIRRELRKPRQIDAREESDWTPPKLGPSFRRRECIVCGEVFKPRKPLQKTCCDLCKAELRVMNSRRAAVEKKGERALVNESLDLLAERLEKRKEIKTEISGETNYAAEIEAYLQKGGKVKVYPVVWMPDIYNSMPEEIF